MQDDRRTFEPLRQPTIDRLIYFCLTAVMQFAMWSCRLLYRLETVGGEYIPTSEPFIVVVNHSSKLDFVHTSFLKQTRSDVHTYGIGAAVLGSRPAAAVGGIPTFKGKGRSLYFLLKARQVLQNGHPLIIAPEGEMEWDGRLIPLQPGAAWLAMRLGIPIVPMVLRGGYSIWPRWAQFPKLTGRLELRIGKPFHIPMAANGRIDEKAIQTASRRITDEMRRLKEEL